MTTPSGEPQPKLRLSIYTDASEVAGAETSVKYLMESLVPSIDVTVLGIDQEVIRDLASSRAGTDAVVVPRVQEGRDLLSIRRLRRAIAATRPHVFQANLANPWTCRYALVAAGSLRGVHTIAVEHSPPGPVPAHLRALKRWTSKRLGAHLAVSGKIARDIEEMVRLRPDSIQVIHNGVPDSAPDRSDLVRADPIVIGCVARLHQQKGVDVLLRALAGLESATLVIVGDGPERSNLEQLCRQLQLGHRVTFNGWEQHVRERLDEFDVFVLPSRTEGFPLSTIEAMLAGLPVVVTDVGDAAVAVSEGHTGFVVPPDDVDALRMALALLVEDEPRRTSMGRASRERALKEFSADVMARRYERVYRSVLGAAASESLDA